MSIKPGGFLEAIIRRYDDETAARAGARICETCGNLIQVGEKALGCTAHDKLIIPEYPPYHTFMRCLDWAPPAASTVEMENARCERSKR